MKKIRALFKLLLDVLKDDRAEIVLSDKQLSLLRELKIGKMLYRITSVFEGKKDIDKVIERLAVKNAMDDIDEQ